MFVVADACGDRTATLHTGTLERESRRSYAVVGIDAGCAFAASAEDGSLFDAAWPNFTQLEK